MQCWWFRCQTQTREDLLKVCPGWRDQQKVLWAEVLKETGRRKSWWKIRWKIQDLLANGRRSQAMPGFLSIIRQMWEG